MDGLWDGKARSWIRVWPLGYVLMSFKLVFFDGQCYFAGGLLFAHGGESVAEGAEIALDRRGSSSGNWDAWDYRQFQELISFLQTIFRRCNKDGAIAIRNFTTA